MMWTRGELKDQAKEALQRNYWKIVLVTALLFLLGCEAGGFSFSTKTFNTGSGNATNAEQAAEVEKSIITVKEEPKPGELIGQVIGNGEIEVGGKRFMRMSVEGIAQVKEIAYGFDHSYKNVVKVLFYRDLYVFLWALLFIIPGLWRGLYEGFSDSACRAKRKLNRSACHGIYMVRKSKLQVQVFGKEEKEKDRGCGSTYGRAFCE